MIVFLNTIPTFITKSLVGEVGLMGSRDNNIYLTLNIHGELR